MEADLEFIDRIGLKEHLSPTRANGLLSMAKQMKFYALAFQAQNETPMDEEQLQKIGEEVVQVLSEIYDPEIPVDIYQLGLIYDVQVSEDRM